MTDIIIYEAKKDAPLNISVVTLQALRKVAQVFGRWFSKEHLWAYFHGTFSRDNGAIERGIKKLVDRGEWIAHPFEKRLVYSPKRVHRLRGHSYPEKMYHELCVTGCFVRLWRADESPQVVSITGKPLKPDFALELSTNTTVAVEFCTESNFKKVLKWKVEKYPRVIEGIEKPLVLFVCDVDMKLIEGFINRNRDLLTILHNGQSISPYYFADYRLFREVPLGEALTTPIYFWQDGSKGALRVPEHS